MMIPVLSCPVVNRSDLLSRMLQSIDYPVDTLHVIVNSDDAGVNAVLEQFVSTRTFRRLSSSNISNVYVDRTPFNLGVAASWNRSMRTYPTAEFWLFIGNDIQLWPGDLGRMDAFIRSHPDYVTCPANWGHSLFAVTQAGLRQIGYFDESVWPAYLEDSDHMYRVKLAKAKWADVPGVRALHGEPPLWGSSTVQSDRRLFKRCVIQQRNNHAWYVRKWGGMPGEEKYFLPYDDAQFTYQDTPIDTSLLEANGHPEYGGKL